MTGLPLEVATTTGMRRWASSTSAASVPTIGLVEPTRVASDPMESGQVGWRLSVVRPDRDTSPEEPAVVEAGCPPPLMAAGTLHPAAATVVAGMAAGSGHP